MYPSLYPFISYRHTVPTYTNRQNLACVYLYIRTLNSHYTHIYPHDSQVYLYDFSSPLPNPHIDPYTYLISSILPPSIVGHGFGCPSICAEVNFAGLDGDDTGLGMFELKWHQMGISEILRRL